jgi:deazaflavin-dependent oxidoreductase (nitroreductase family)
MPVLELLTTGHKSGQERSILITYVDTPDGPALAGSNAGASSDPGWVKNLRQDPDASIRRGGEWQHVRARFPEAEERADIWGRFIEADDGYADYEEMVSREIPIVVLVTDA